MYYVDSRIFYERVFLLDKEGSIFEKHPRRLKTVPKSFCRSAGMYHASKVQNRVIFGILQLVASFLAPKINQTLPRVRETDLCVTLVLEYSVNGSFWSTKEEI